MIGAAGEAIGKRCGHVEFYVERAVLDLGVKVVFVVIEGMDNARDSLEWNAEHPMRLAALVERWRGQDLHADPVLEGFYELHDRAHVRRKHNVPAPVTLIKLLVKRGGASSINKVVDIYNTLKEYTSNITIYDPWANPAAVEHEYGIKIVNELPTEKFDAAIAAVAHKEFADLDILSLLNEKHVIYDVKCTLDRAIVDGRL